MAGISFKQEPAAWVAAIKAIIVAVMAFGVKITADQLAALVFAMEAIGSLVIRQNVYSPIDREGNPIQLVKGEKPGDTQEIPLVPQQPRLSPEAELAAMKEENDKLAKKITGK